MIKKSSKIKNIALSTAIIAPMIASFTTNIASAELLKAPEVKVPEVEKKEVKTNNEAIDKLIAQLQKVKNNQPTKEQNKENKEEEKNTGKLIETNKIEPTKDEKTETKKDTNKPENTATEGEIIKLERIRGQNNCNCKITTKKVNIRREPGKDYEYSITYRLIDFETGKIIKQFDKFTKNKLTLDRKDIELPPGYTYDYLTNYVGFRIWTDVNVDIPIRRNRYIRFHDKDGNLIANCETNRFLDYYNEVIPSYFKTPKHSFNGFRQEGDLYIKDMVLEEFTEENIDYSKDSETVNAQIKRLQDAKAYKAKLIQTKADNEKQALNAKDVRNEKTASKTEVSKVEGVPDSERKNKTINPDVKVKVTFTFIDDTTGIKVGEYTHPFSENENVTLKGLPAGYETVGYSDSDINRLAWVPFQVKIHVKRTMPVADLIKLNDSKSEKDQLLTNRQLANAYDKVTNSNTLKELDMKEFPIDPYQPQIGDNRQFHDLSKEEQIKWLENRIESDKKTKTYDQRLDGLIVDTNKINEENNKLIENNNKETKIEISHKPEEKQSNSKKLIAHKKKAKIQQKEEKPVFEKNALDKLIDAIVSFFK